MQTLDSLLALITDEQNVIGTLQVKIANLQQQLAAAQAAVADSPEAQEKIDAIFAIAVANRSTLSAQIAAIA